MRCRTALSDGTAYEAGNLSPSTCPRHPETLTSLTHHLSWPSVFPDSVAGTRVLFREATGENKTAKGSQKTGIISSSSSCKQTACPIGCPQHSAPLPRRAVCGQRVPIDLCLPAKLRLLAQLGCVAYRAKQITGQEAVGGQPVTLAG